MSGPGPAPAEAVPDIGRLHRKLRWGVLGLVLAWMAGMGAFNLFWSYRLVELEYRHHMTDQAAALAAQVGRDLARGEPAGRALARSADWPDRMHDIDLLGACGDVIASTRNGHSAAGCSAHGAGAEHPEVASLARVAPSSVAAETPPPKPPASAGGEEDGYGVTVPVRSGGQVAALRLWMPTSHLHQSYGHLLALNLGVMAAGGLLLAALMGVTTVRAGRGYETLLGQVKELEARAARARQLEAVGRMAAGVAHEIRNPLNAIGLGLQRLAEGLQQESRLAGELEPRAGEPAKAPLAGERPGDSSSVAANRLGLVSRLHDEVRRVNAAVEDFLSLARPLKLERARFDLAQLVRHLVELYGPEAEQAGVYLTMRVSGLPLPVTADRDRLNQALANLVKNGIEAAGRGGSVEVGASCGEEAVSLWVSDTGPGPAGADFEALFEDFHTTRGQGTGLGLPMTRRILEAHGGALAGARSDDRTLFTATLPAA